MSNAAEPLRVRAFPLTVQPDPTPCPATSAATPDPVRVRKFADVLPLQRRRSPGTERWPTREMEQRPSPGSGPARSHGSAGPMETSAEERALLREESRHVTQIARAVGQAAFEALARTRPLHQLARWLDPENFEKMRLRVELTEASVPAAQERHYRNAVVRRSRVCRVAEHTYEVALVIADQQRVRAAALRIEQRRGQWKVSALEIG